MILGIVLGVIGLVSIGIYNSLIKKRNAVYNAQGGLDTQLKQRYDLIPELVSTIKVYMEHEKTVLERIVELRNTAIGRSVNSQEKMNINKEITQDLSKIMVQVEQYPLLKANENFNNLQKALYEVEENIAASRRFFNTAVTEYNNGIETFPSNFFGNLMGLKKKEVFSIPDLEKVRVNVGELFGKKAS